MNFPMISRARAMQIALTLVAALLSGLPANAADDELAAKAYKLLADRCNGCHGGASEKVQGFRILDRDLLTFDRGDDRDPYITPGNPDASELYARASDGSMPPEASGIAPLTEAELQTLSDWIKDGAKFPRADRDERRFISEADILRAISDHNRREDISDRPFYRYFSFAHLHNNQTVTQDQLRVFKAALSKAINAMSRERSIVVPEVVDPKDETCYVDRRNGHETIFAIDLRDVGWDEDLDAWEKVIEAYPYGLKPPTQDRDAVNAFGDIERDYGSLFDEIPYVRADWFVAEATRPPLYHELADIPENLEELLKKFNIDVEDAFLDKKLSRAGIFESGVSGQNRLIEVHDTSAGDLWLSYDFDLDSGRSNLARFPLGPKFDDDRLSSFEPFAFEHAGGEIIWNLPNGMHAYMLIATDGTRIDKGPVSIVWDANETSGNPEIVNGLSCMYCHKQGMIDFADEIREGHALKSSPLASDKIDDLFIDERQMQRRLDRSRQEYLRAFERAVGDYLTDSDGNRTPIEKFPEPVNQLARFYDRPLDIEAVACELGMESPEDLRSSIGSKSLILLGLEPLRKQPEEGVSKKLLVGKIKRSYWDSSEDGLSIFQRAAVELNRGRAINP